MFLPGHNLPDRTLKIHLNKSISGEIILVWYFFFIFFLYFVPLKFFEVMFKGRGDRVVEGARLESVCAVWNSTGGSNPFLSADYSLIYLSFNIIIGIFNRY